MTPDGKIIPIVEDDQGEGMMDVFSYEELKDPLESIQIKLEKFRRRKANKEILR